MKDVASYSKGDPSKWPTGTELYKMMGGKTRAWRHGDADFLPGDNIYMHHLVPVYIQRELNLVPDLSSTALRNAPYKAEIDACPGMLIRGNRHITNGELPSTLHDFLDPLLPENADRLAAMDLTPQQVAEKLIKGYTDAGYPEEGLVAAKWLQTKFPDAIELP